MVFSFLKKGSGGKQKTLSSSPQDEEPQPPLPQAAEASPIQPKELPDEDHLPLEELGDLGDFAFNDSVDDFYVEQETDPVHFFAEEAAVLFANGQDDEAREHLEQAVSEHKTPKSERLWFMLFDLYRLCLR